jgi:hypothetical protein
MFSPNQAIPIGEKVEINPNGCTPGGKAELEKIFSICPKLLINAELYGLELTPKAGKRITIKFGRQICNPWGPTFQHLFMS